MFTQNKKEGGRVRNKQLKIKQLSMLSCRVWGLVLLLSCFVLPLWGQAAADQAPEDSFAQKRVALLNLLVYSDDMTEKLLALQELENLMKSGRIRQDDEELIHTVLTLARQGSGVRLYDSELNVTNNNVVLRIQACNLLAIIGGPLALNSLLSVMNNDPDPTLVAIAMEELAKIDADNSSIVLDYIVNVFIKFHNLNKSNTLADSFLKAVDSYVQRTNGEAINPRVSMAVHLINLPSSSYGTIVRVRARDMILNWIRSY